MGRNGTVVSTPHAEQWVRVSALTRGPPLARFALHCLQRFGSFLKSLSWKKSCSPAVKMKSEPQSTHFRTLSVNSMAGFPEGGNVLKSAMTSDAPVPFPCLRTLSNTRARAAYRISGELGSRPGGEPGRDAPSPDGAKMYAIPESNAPAAFSNEFGRKDTVR